jgi:hypothetical protein
MVLGSTMACAGSDTVTPSGTSSSSAAPPTSSGVPSSTSGGPSATSVTPSTTATTSATLASIPVYYVAESQRSFKLYREFRRVPDRGGAVTSAVSAMTSLAPLDPDYMTPWRPATRITVSQKGGNLAVDLSADAFSNSNVGSGLAAAAIQELVYTATAAAAQAGSPASTVTITKDGRAADVWGVLRIGEPTRRAAPLDVQAQVWVTAPQEGDVRKAGVVRFAGYGTSFEATFGWVVRTRGGRTVARGSAMGGTGTGGFGPFTFSTTLKPGTYIVVVATDDPSGGASGNGPATDDKTFTVR